MGLHTAYLVIYKYKSKELFSSALFQIKSCNLLSIKTGCLLMLAFFDDHIHFHEQVLLCTSDEDPHKNGFHVFYFVRAA